MSEYDYPRFLYAVARHRGRDCWVEALLEARVRGFVPLTVGDDGVKVYRDSAQAFQWRTFMGCDGPMDAHHVAVSKQRIKARHAEDLRVRGAEPFDLDAALMDPRNGVIVCRRHHDLLERRLVVPVRAELPEDAVEFAAEVGMSWSIDRDYGEAA